MNSLEQRRKNYFQLSSEIAQLDQAQLNTLFGESDTSHGWGKNHTLDLDGSKVFVKRVPMTSLEYENQFSTRNLYNLPTYYNYGVGSAGFGVFRELVAHIKTTNWVLDGEIDTFPLMYHYRSLPFSGTRSEVNPENHQKYVDYWGGSENIGNYMIDRANADYELVLFLEHIPHVLEPWLLANPGHIRRSLEDLRRTITFLRTKGIIHFDAHFYNILTDGERAYLTDFGLVLDEDFDLNAEEKAFFRQHTHYDYGEVLSCFGSLIYPAFDSLSDADKHHVRGKYNIEEGADYHKLVKLLIDNLEEIHADGRMNLDPGYVDAIIQYRSIINFMQTFYFDIRENHRKDTHFDHERLKILLSETGFLPETTGGDTPGSNES